MNTLDQLGSRVEEIQIETLIPVARRFGFSLPANHLQPNRLPSVLFLGNHSSGKSTFINHMVGAEVQKTGLAPTDDGFTVIMHGNAEDETDGATTVTHPQLDCEPLGELGTTFLSKLRLKTFPHPILESLVLIDSPGMIDAAQAENDRGYDFGRAVETFAERADLILFFFDPDKPGTTGETLRIFTEILSGMSHKLLILMHKVDQFRNIRDFARTYATLCWNLAKIIKSKDIPPIFNTYLPSETLSSAQGLPLHDFDQSREEVIDQIRRAPLRRMDNLVSDLYRDTALLEVHIRVLRKVGRRAARVGLAALGVGIAALAAGGLTGYEMHSGGNTLGMLVSVSAGILAAILAVAASRFTARWMGRRYESKERLDKVFREEFRDEITGRNRNDLWDRWNWTKDETSRWFRLNVLKPRPFRRAKGSLEKLRRLREAEVPRLRRHLTGD